MHKSSYFYYGIPSKNSAIYAINLMENIRRLNIIEVPKYVFYQIYPSIPFTQFLNVLNFIPSTLAEGESFNLFILLFSFMCEIRQ